MIKTQEDVKNDVKSKKRSVTEKLKTKPLPVQDHEIQPQSHPIGSGVSDIMDIFEERISNIELYLESTSNIMITLEQIPNNIVQITHELELIHARLDNITNNMIGFAELEDHRYNELANMITGINDTLIQLDQLVPVFVDNRIAETMKVDKIKVIGDPIE